MEIYVDKRTENEREREGERERQRRQRYRERDKWKQREPAATGCTRPTAHLAFVNETWSASISAGKRALSTPTNRLWTQVSLGARGNSWLSRSFVPVERRRCVGSEKGWLV